MGTLTMLGDKAELKDWAISVGWNLSNQCQHPHNQDKCYLKQALFNPSEN
jgi:hypothetical protein